MYEGIDSGFRVELSSCRGIGCTAQSRRDRGIEIRGMKWCW